MLEEAIHDQRLILHVRRLAADGMEWAEVQRRGYEGLVARWLKSKLRQDGRFVIGGVAMARAGHQRGVLVGEWEGKRLLYRGFVDMGLSRDALDTLCTDAQPIARSTSPFADLIRRRETVWLEPVLEAEVSYGRIVGGGGQLRDPVRRRSSCSDALVACRARVGPLRVRCRAEVLRGRHVQPVNALRHCGSRAPELPAWYRALSR